MDTLTRVKRSGILTVITQNNPSSYYEYRGQFMGFEYDLAKAFADHLNVELKVVTPQWDEIMEYLQSGKGDMIAASLTVTKTRNQIVDFSLPYMTVQQRIIQHRTAPKFDSLHDLNKATIHIRENTSYQERLQELKDFGFAINLILHSNVPTEELLQQVAEKEIRLTVADSHIALLNRKYYPEIYLGIAIKEQQSLAWAVRKGDERFVEAMNAFLKEAKENGLLNRIYERYYGGVDFFDYVDLRIFQRRLTSRLPKYEETIRAAAVKYGFDWRFIAAIAYQESHLNPHARSYTGVRGLMQVTQATAAEMGITDRLDPEESIWAGVGYLAKLWQRFDTIPRQRDRLLLALASYNVGYGHVRDAQIIAKEKGWDFTSWSGVKKALPLLRNPRYYRKTKHGYARGTEPVRYIDRILLYYDILKQEVIS